MNKIVATVLYVAHRTYTIDACGPTNKILRITFDQQLQQQQQHKSIYKEYEGDAKKRTHEEETTASLSF